MSTLQYPPPPPTTCRFCGSVVEQMSETEFYGHDYGGGPIYACTGCEARVGTHASTGKPLGLLADDELVSLRRQLHELFDPLWKETDTDRQEAYDYFFGAMMGYPEEKRHVAMLTKDECRRAITVLKRQGKRRTD